MSENRRVSGGACGEAALATQFKPGQSGNPRGRPEGTISLETRVRRLLEGDEELPEPIVNAIRNQCGADKRAIDAVMIVGLLQALQGDKGWAQFIVERGWGKVTDKQDITSNGKELKAGVVVVASEKDKEALEGI